MLQTELDVQVRPSRVTILLARTASVAQLMLAVQFLSRIWGGRYCPIFSVDCTGTNEYVREWLERDLPDFVYGVGVDNDAWRLLISSVCPIRGYGPLQPDFVTHFHKTPGYYAEDYITFVPILRRVQHQPSLLGRRSFHLVHGDNESLLGPFAAVAFGDCELGLLGRTDVIEHQVVRMDANTSTPDFIRLCLEVVRSGCSWLEMTSLGLDVSLRGLFSYSPMIVLVQTVAADLALFWTLRTTKPHKLPDWILPVPASDVQDAAVLDALGEWAQAALQFRISPEPVRITSLTASRDKLEQIAADLRPRLQGMPVEASR
jgi:hypothetical protein